MNDFVALIDSQILQARVDEIRLLAAASQNKTWKGWSEEVADYMNDRINTLTKQQEGK